MRKLALTILHRKMYHKRVTVLYFIINLARDAKRFQRRWVAGGVHKEQYEWRT